MTLIDCHAHLSDTAFNPDVSDIAAQCALQKIFVISVGMNYDDFDDTIRLSERYSDSICFGLGLHPCQNKGSTVGT